MFCVIESDSTPPCKNGYYRLIQIMLVIKDYLAISLRLPYYLCQINLYIRFERSRRTDHLLRRGSFHGQERLFPCRCSVDRSTRHCTDMYLYSFEKSKFLFRTMQFGDEWKTGNKYHIRIVTVFRSSMFCISSWNPVKCARDVWKEAEIKSKYSSEFHDDPSHRIIETYALIC